MWMRLCAVGNAILHKPTLREQVPAVGGAGSSKKKCWGLP